MLLFGRITFQCRMDRGYEKQSMYDAIKQLNELENKTGNKSINHIKRFSLIKSEYFEYVHDDLKSKTNAKC